MPSISVIIPTYNRAHLLKRALQSALNQTLGVHEVIIADDGSNDDTKNMVKTLKSNKLVYIKLPHSGHPSVPRNAGIKASSGEWLAFLDSDDEWHESKLEKQMEKIKKTGLMACSTNAQIRKNHAVTGKVLLQYGHESVTFNDLLQTNWIICSSVLIKKSLVELTKGFEERIEFKGVEDYDLWLRAATLTNFAYVNEPLVIYSDNPQNSVRSEQFLKSEFEQKKLLLAHLKSWAKNGHKLKISQKIRLFLYQIKMR